jgi:hypothetical protein
VHHVVSREFVDFEEVHFGFKFWHFGHKLIEPFLGATSIFSSSKCMVRSDSSAMAFFATL